MVFMLFGGMTDPEIRWMKLHLDERKIEYIPIFTDTENNIVLTFNYQNNSLTINDKDVGKDITCGFIRFNAFSTGSEYKKNHRWHTIITGWLALNPHVKIFNREWIGRFNSKVSQLMIAKQLGFRIPETVLTNNYTYIKTLDKDKYIVKPIDNGYCETLESAVENINKSDKNIQLKIVNNTSILPNPAFIQERLSYPEYRAFFVSDQHLWYKLISDNIDNRTDDDLHIEYIDPDKLTDNQHNLNELINKLSNKQSLTYGAVDFKTDPINGELVFLEINDNPMFSGFDVRSCGVIVNYMLDFLTGE